MIRPSVAFVALIALSSCGAAPSASPAATPAPSLAVSSKAAPASTSASTAASKGATAPTAASTGTAAGASSAASSATTTTASTTPAAPALPAVSLVQVEPTKGSGKLPVLGISAPAKNALIATAKAATFEGKVTVKDWKPTGGDHLCVVLDKRPCKRIEDASKAFKLAELGALDEGQHVLSVMARRASGEFYRPSGKSVPFASVTFFVGKKVPAVHKDGAPMLFYSAPEAGKAPAEGVLLDFFVANAEVRSGDAVVTASVGGPGIESGVGLAIQDNKPLRLLNARPGEYLSRFTLMKFVPDLGPANSSAITVTYSAKPVPGPFGQVERTFNVTK